jgi:hypothetical protein
MPPGVVVLNHKAIAPGLVTWVPGMFTYELVPLNPADVSANCGKIPGLPNVTLW